MIPRTLTAICLLLSSFAYSQTDTTGAGSFEDLSLADLLNVKVVSVSKQDERLFDAPLSASVLTREAILKAGSTSVMEALRLIPGMIVREQSNGNYDIHLRMDNSPPNSPFDVLSNTTTLVMVDNRPIYNYLKGGTFWETLPVDLHDIEKIEVVRGPAAALYGPNAVNGVINIITRELKKSGFNATASTWQGSYRTSINNAYVGYKGRKWNVRASGNYQTRERTQLSYFEIFRNQWLENPLFFKSLGGAQVNNVSELYPDQSLALEKQAFNGFVTYTPTDKVSFALTAGNQHSESQKVSAENEITPLSTSRSDSRYADLRIQAKELTAQFSYNTGTQITDYAAGNKYNFNTFDGNAEYNYTRGNFALKPGISFRNAIYDDTPYSDTLSKTGIFNTRGNISTISLSLRSEYKLMDDKLRLVAGASTNTFNYPDTTYISYQFAGTYKLNSKHLVRAVYSSAPRSPSIFDTYVNQIVARSPIGPKKFIHAIVAGNKNLKLLTSNMLEVGYRGVISSRLNVDVELFSTVSQNYNTSIVNRLYTKLAGTDTILVLPAVSTNLPLKMMQKGITASFTYNTNKLQFRPFITIQQAKTKNYAPFLNTPDAIVPFSQIQKSKEFNIYSAMGTKGASKKTPGAFGGASLNYMFSKKFNASMSAYYYSSHTYDHISKLLLSNMQAGEDRIAEKLILNMNLSYQPIKGLQVFFNGKNLLNNKAREFFNTDAAPFMFLGGLKYEL